MILGITLLVIGIILLLSINLIKQEDTIKKEKVISKEFEIVFKPWWVSSDFCEIHYRIDGKDYPLYEIENPILDHERYKLRILMYEVPFNKDEIREEFPNLDCVLKHNIKIREGCDLKNKELQEYRDKVKKKKQDFYNSK